MTSAVSLAAKIAQSSKVIYSGILCNAVSLPFIRGDLAVIITFRLMGRTRDKQAVRLWDTDDLAYIREQTKDFLPPNHFDAFCIFEFQALQAAREYGMKSDEVKRTQEMSQLHRRSINEDQFRAEMTSLGLVTVIDIRNHGENLSKPLLHQ